MAKSECVTCAWEKKGGVIVDPTLATKQAWADRVGVSEASIRRHVAHSIVLHEAQSYISKSDDVDQMLTQMGIPESVVASRGMSLRDPVTGSWQKVTWYPNKKALEDTLKFDDLKEALDGWSTWEVPAGVKPQAAILNMADLQIGKAEQRGGGTPETIASVKASVEKFVQHIRETGVGAAVLVDNGDPIENVFNVPSQLVTNDLSVPDQIRVFRRLMLDAIKRVAPIVKTLYYVSIPSNHGAARTGYKSPGGTVDADFGLEISYQIEDAIAENPHLRNVKFVRPEALSETAELEVSGTKLAFNHGHQSGGVFKHGNWWRGHDHGRMAGWDADIFVFGHFHTSAVYQSGNGRWVVGCASSDPGSDWFTNRTGESATRGMTAFDVLDGKIINHRII